MGLELDGLVALGLGNLGDLVEQHGLSHAPEAGEQEALLRAALEDPCEQDSALFEDVLASNELWRRRTGARAEGVVDGVHGECDLYRSIVIYTRYRV